MRALNFGKVSEDLLVRAIRVLHHANEEDGGAIGDAATAVGSPTGGLDSASKLGMIPKPSLPKYPRVRVRKSTQYAKRDEALDLKTDALYMISWMDPKYGKVLKGQKKLQNGLYYVTEKNKDKAKEIYQGLVNQGIDNVKLDLL